MKVALCAVVLAVVVLCALDPTAVAWALPALIALLGALVGCEVTVWLCRCQAETELRQALKEFPLWLASTLDVSRLARVGIKSDMGRRELLSSSPHADKHANAFVDLTFLVKGQWLSQVERCRGTLLAYASKRALARIDKQLAADYQQVEQSRQNSLNKFHDETAADLEKIDASCAKWFREAVSTRLGSDWRTSL
ncbi:MAG: hypothetical protein KAX44_02435 [Candidatus Brocadiae bacterium]|nr:hypothetical protein [Candidatus Brocadiia bacterium]